MTTENKHTPGPWPMKKTGDGKRILVGIGLIDGPNGYDVAEVYSDDCDRDEATANASLIAAAPDLLEALELIVNSGAWYLSALEIDTHKKGYTDGEDMERIARAIIAKARGQ